MVFRFNSRSKWQIASSVGAVVLLTGMLLSQADASSLKQKEQTLQSLQSQASQANQKLNQEKNQQAQLKKQIQSYTKANQDSAQTISENMDEMTELQSEIQELNSHIFATQTELTADQKKLEKMVLSAYENGNVPYLQVLFQATSWQDFLNRMNLLAEVSHSEQQMVNQVQSLEKQLTDEKSQQKTTYRKLSVQTAQLQTLIQDNQKLISQKKQAMTVVSRNVTLQSQNASELDDQVHYTKTEIVQLQAETAADELKMQNKSYVASAEKHLSSASSSAVVSYAEQFLGVPYVWGGASPSGFDCSGFTMYVYAHFGITLYHSAASQFGGGVSVSRSDLQPGDLVFYDTEGGGVSHVGIYIGGGKMINAERTGLPVRITDAFGPYWGSRYLGAREYIRH